MKKVLERYLKKFFESHIKEYGVLPKVAAREEINTGLYVGELDKEGWSQWQYKQNVEGIKFDEYEKNMHQELRREVKEFFETFYFLELSGFYEEDYISFVAATKAFKPEYELVVDLNSDNRVYLGTCADLPLCCLNDTGKIVIYDWECDEEIPLCNNLQELVENMTPFLKEE